MKQVVRIIVGRYYIENTDGVVIDHGTLEVPLSEILEKLNPNAEISVIVEEYKNVPRG